MPKKAIAMSLDMPVIEELKKQAVRYGFNVSEYIGQLVAFVYKNPGHFVKDKITNELVYNLLD